MARYNDYSEYLRHPLFRMARAIAFRRAGGKCEDCGAPATEVHHFQPAPNKYPVWGAFDTPGNLRVICHECHSREHGKLNGAGE
jgi:5-methylcytosine-specific restriction endonuclease McrA